MWNCDEQDWHTYIVLFLGTSSYYSQFPYSRQSLLYYPTLAWVRISSRYPILKFAFPHTRPSTDQVLFLCDYRYISDPGTNFLCFIKTWWCSTSDLSFLQQALPWGLRVVVVALLRFMGGLLTENVCSLWFSFVRHLVLISPPRAPAISSVIYHFLESMGLFGGGSER